MRNGPKREQVKRIRFLIPKFKLTYKQKEDICKQITSMNPEDLPGLLDIVKPRKTGEDAEVEIDVETMDDETIIKIQRYIYEKNEK